MELNLHNLIKLSRNAPRILFIRNKKIRHISSCSFCLIQNIGIPIAHSSWFTQRFSVQSFFRQEDHTKQIPFLFYLMCGCRKKVYMAFLKCTIEMLQHKQNTFNARP